MKASVHVTIRMFLWVLVVLTGLGSALPLPAAALPIACSSQGEEQHGEPCCEGSSEIGKKSLHRHLLRLKRVTAPDPRPVHPPAEPPVPSLRPHGVIGFHQAYVASALGLRAPPASP